MARRQGGVLRLAPSRTNLPSPALVYRNGGTSAPADAPTSPGRLDEGRLHPLVERARDGDARAFEEIVRMMQGPVRAFARRMMRDQHLGDDAAQEIFLRMWRGLRTHEPRGRFIAWTFTIARNTCIEILRREARTPTPLEDIEGGSCDPAEESVLRRVVNDAIARLEEPFRSTLLLRETGLPYDQLAAVLDCPVGTVRSRLHEARRRLAEELTSILEVGR